MSQEYADDVNVVFVEVQNSSADEIESLALDRKWFGTNAMWTTERPVITGGSGIPNFVLLSPDGEVVAMGHPLAQHKEIEDFIVAAKRERTRAPRDVPKELSAAWKHLAKGDVAKAIDAAEGVIARPPSRDGDAVVVAARALIESAHASAKQRLGRVEHAIEDGAFAFATDAAKQLVKDLPGDDHQHAQKLLDRLLGEELAAEVKAEGALAKIERRLYDKGADKATGRWLTKLAEQHDGTKAAARARRLAELVED